MARSLPGTGSQRPRKGRAQTITGPPETPFRLHYPGGWRKVPKGELQKQPEPPAAAVRQPDAYGLVTLTIRGPLAYPLPKMREDFLGVLEEKYAENDLEIVSSQDIETAAGVGMYTSWVLRDVGRVYGHLTVQVGQHSYTLDGTLPVGGSEVAREVGSIIGSFEVVQPDPPDQPGDTPAA
jgi:hypothetical protein